MLDFCLGLYTQFVVYFFFDCMRCEIWQTTRDYHKLIAQKRLIIFYEH